MRDLFKAELLRFRGWAIAGAALHLLVLGFLARVVDLAQQPLLVYRVFGGVYALAGLLLGLYQMGSYRRPNVWLNLLHRPLPDWRIAAALLGAGILLLAVAAALPVLLIAGYQAGMTARVVDLRHWLFPLAALLIAACGYLAGAFCMLGGRRYSACALVFLALLAVSQATGPRVLLLQAIALLWLAAMVLAAFKPDLSAPPRSPAATAVTALPLQMGVYSLMLLLGFGMEMLWIMQGTHPNNTGVPPPGGHNETERMTPQQRMLAGLAASRAPQAPLWREQVALSEVQPIGVQVVATPVRNELTHAAAEQTEFDDDERRVRWVFSHDRMRFEGYRLTDGRRAGELGVGGGDAPFPAPAQAAGGLPGLPKGDGTLVAGNVLYRYDGAAGQALPRIVLPAGEILAGVTPVGESLVVTSDRALYFFDGRDAATGDALLRPRQRLPIPGRSGDLRSVELIELVDGYLVSFSFTSYAHELTGATPYQNVLWVDDGGRVTPVAHRAMAYDYSAPYRYKAWWPSPALYALRVGAIGLFAPADPLQATAPAPMPRGIQVFAGALMLLSLLAAIPMSLRRALSTPARMAWVLACGVIGLPALASLWLLYPARGQAEPQRQLQPAAA
ncbi:hypothetical protein ASG87_12425 [Frateuria sp. Soil773]|uniref:hypothetical protein n=1 Tax=Frateuria sp. Soil773 TaxID=1736407 RepID=UPI0006F2A792|nr:hypothetical protein [Frateuria sp. Soil773]KRF01205.1 hypothetical protein ASG87_12425 [Frateuria sp. Soil773]